VGAGAPGAAGVVAVRAGVPVGVAVLGAVADRPAAGRLGARLRAPPLATGPAPGAPVCAVAVGTGRASAGGSS